MNEPNLFANPAHLFSHKGIFSMQTVNCPLAFVALPCWATNPVAHSQPTLPPNPFSLDPSDGSSLGIPNLNFNLCAGVSRFHQHLTALKISLAVMADMFGRPQHSSKSIHNSSNSHKQEQHHRQSRQIGECHLPMHPH